MALHSKSFRIVFAAFLALAMTIGLQSAVAEDVAHAVSGVVKSVDKDSKTFVVKAADGTEHTFKWTETTTVKGAKETGKGVDAASKDTAKGVEAGSVETAKGTEKASVDTYLGAKKVVTITVKYTEKGGEKTAIGIKDASKATAKAVE